MCGINLFFFGEFTTIKIERAKKEKPSGIGPFCEQKKNIGLYASIMPTGAGTFDG